MFRVMLRIRIYVTNTLEFMKVSLSNEFYGIFRNDASLNRMNKWNFLSAFEFNWYLIGYFDPNTPLILWNTRYTRTILRKSKQIHSKLIELFVICGHWKAESLVLFSNFTSSVWWCYCVCATLCTVYTIRMCERKLEMDWKARHPFSIVYCATFAISTVKFFRNLQLGATRGKE